MTKTVNLSQVNAHYGNLADKILEASGEDVRRCYQCGKCSAGCPVHNCGGMDISPNRIMRMCQLGMEEEILNSKTIWVCVLCSTCSTRCPRNIDIAAVMDCLRIMSKKQNKVKNAGIANDFHDIFIKSISIHGRVYELGLMASLMFRTGDFFSDLDIGFPTIIKGNLPFLPPTMRNREQVKQIMANIKKLEDQRK